MFEELMKLRVKVIFRVPSATSIGEEDNGVIKIGLTNCRRANDNPAKVFLHELLHRKYPDWSETAILNAERNLWNKLTPHQRYRVYRKLFNHKYTSEVTY